MKKYIFTAVLVVVLAFTHTATAQQVGIEQPGTEKLAQTGFKFLAMPVNPRVAAMADALTADEAASAVSIFTNPASMASMTDMVNFSASQMQFIAEINYNSASVAFAPASGRFGVFGLSMISVDYGDIIGTIRSSDPSNTKGYEKYVDMGFANPSPTAMSIGFAYARTLTDRFSIGGHIKYAVQDFDTGVLRAADGGGYETTDNNLNTIGFDFGLLYRTGFRSLNFAMTARNFSKEIKYFEENFELPLLFKMGVSMDLMDFTAIDKNVHSFKVAVDAERPRDFDENLRVGGEYTFMKTLSLRAGYAYPHTEQGVSLGAGVHTSLSGFEIGGDYSYTDFGIFGSVNRLAVQVGF